MDTDLIARVQQAIEASDFEQVPVLISEYGADVRQRLRSTDSTEDREQIAGQALEELRGLLVLAKVLRSHVSLSLQTTQAPLRYSQSDKGAHTWRIEA